MKSYTYIIKHKPSGRAYYGYRGANKVEPYEDLWHKYFTSSPKVKELIAEDGPDSFDIQIRRTFIDMDEAIKWETTVLRRLKVLEKDIWINANIAGYIPSTPQQRKKISEYHMGKPKTEEHKRKISQAQKGRPKPKGIYNTPEHRAKMSAQVSGKNNPRYGVEVSEETRRKISEANKGRPAHNKGKPMSEEQKLKISLAKRKRNSH